MPLPVGGLVFVMAPVLTFFWHAKKKPVTYFWMIVPLPVLHKKNTLETLLIVDEKKFL